MTKKKITFERAKALYVHRYTMEHKPTWASEPTPDGRYHAPQYADDKEWYENTVFPTDGRQRYCRSTNMTWPLGQWLQTERNAHDAH